MNREGDRHEVPVVAGREREALRRSGCHVEDQPRLAPGGVLTRVDVEGAAGDLAEQHVAIAGDQLAILEADREAAVTAASRLIEHERPTVRLEAIDRLQGGCAGGHTRRCGPLAHRCS
jgi:hypothetical protein